MMIELSNAQGAPILSIEDWTRPKQAYQWKDGRSAKELAKAWRPGDSGPSCPQALRALLDSHPLTRYARLIEGRPEHVTPLPERGGGRNHDLWIRAEVDDAPLTICIEAKADEPFGEPIGEYLQRSRAKNPRTGSARRARETRPDCFRPGRGSGNATVRGAFSLSAAYGGCGGSAAGTTRRRFQSGVNRARVQNEHVDPRKVEANKRTWRRFSRFSRAARRPRRRAALSGRAACRRTCSPVTRPRGSSGPWS